MKSGDRERDECTERRRETSKEPRLEKVCHIFALRCNHDLTGAPLSQAHMVSRGGRMVEQRVSVVGGHPVTSFLSFSQRALFRLL